VLSCLFRAPLYGGGEGRDDSPRSSSGGIKGRPETYYSPCEGPCKLFFGRGERDRAVRSANKEDWERAQQWTLFEEVISTSLYLPRQVLYYLLERRKRKGSGNYSGACGRGKRGKKNLQGFAG